MARALPRGSVPPSLPMAKSLQLGLVNQVLSGDTIEIRQKVRNGPPSKLIIVLSNINCRKLARKPSKGNPCPSGDEPYAWESREFLRREVIGKEVCFYVEKEVRPGTFYGVVYLGRTSSDISLQALMVEAGFAQVRVISNPEINKDKAYQYLLALQKEAQSKSLNIWSQKPVYLERNVIWRIPDPAHFVQTYKNQGLSAVVDYVRDGSSMQVIVRPDPNKSNFYVFMISLTGIRTPSIKWKDNEQIFEPYAQEAQFFVEARVLNRDVKVYLEDSVNQTIIASVLHPNGNIALVLLREGLAWCFDRTFSVLSPDVGTPEDYLAGENSAKQSSLRIWKDWEPPVTTPSAPSPESTYGFRIGDKFDGLVIEVGNGDNVTIKCPDGLIQKFFLTRIRGPKPTLPEATLVENAEENQKTPTKPTLGTRIRPLYDVPYAFEAREFMRKSLIGKKVEVNVEYIQPKLSGAVLDDRVFASIHLGSTNIAEALVSKGLASVIRYRTGAQNAKSFGPESIRTTAYDSLLAAEAQAQKKHLGIFSSDASSATGISVIDLSGAPAKAKQFLPILKRHGRIPAVVEFITSTSRMRLYIPKESLNITLLLSGIDCPRPSRGIEPGDPFGDEAYEFIREICMLRDVEIEVESIDRAGNFISWLFLVPQKSEDEPNKPVTGGKNKSKAKKATLSGGVTISNVSILLVSNGFAIVHHARSIQRSAYYLELCKAEESARKERTGQWSSEDFVKAWEAQNADLDRNGDTESKDNLDLDYGLEEQQTDSKNEKPKHTVRSRVNKPDYLDHLASLSISSETITKHEAIRNSQRKCVEISAVVDPTSDSLGIRFFAQNITNAPDIERIILDLNSPGVISDSCITEFTPRPGALCAANYGEDKQWYRAKIIKLNGNEAIVQYIDFGNQERVFLHEKRLAKLPGTDNQPPLATEYRLAAVQLPSGRADQIEASLALGRLVQNKRLYLFVEHSPIGCGKKDPNPVPGVSVTWSTIPEDSTSQNGSSGVKTDKKDLAEELLRLGLVYMEPSKQHILTMPRHLIASYAAAQKAAKDQHLKIWQYGDFREDLSE